MRVTRAIGRHRLEISMVHRADPHGSVAILSASQLGRCVGACKKVYGTER